MREHIEDILVGGRPMTDLELKDKEIEDYSNKFCKLAKAKTKSDNIINELEKDLYKIRDLTFTKYNSNEWNNCLSFNDDILPIINRLKELKGDDSNE